LPVWIE
jgi:hypothetical protein